MKTINYALLALPICFSAALYASEGSGLLSAGGNKKERQNSTCNNQTDLDQQLKEAIRNLKLHLEKIAEALNDKNLTISMIHDIPHKFRHQENQITRTFAENNKKEIMQAAQSLKEKPNPTLNEIEHTLAGLYFVNKYSWELNTRGAAERLAKEFLNSPIIRDILATIKCPSNEAQVDDSLRVLNLLETFYPCESAQEELGLKIYESRYLLEQQRYTLKEQAEAKRREDARLEAQRNAEAKQRGQEEAKSKQDPQRLSAYAFSKKRLMTLGGIALIAAALYYFGYAKKDAKGAKANPLPKK